MKKTIVFLLVFSLFYSLTCKAQESFKKRYQIKPKLTFKSWEYDKSKKGKNVLKIKTEEKHLKKDSYESYLLLDENDKIRVGIEKKISDVANNLRYSAELFNLKGEKITITEKEAKSSTLKQHIAYNKKAIPDFYKDGNNFTYKGNVLFEKEKLYINLWNFSKSTYVDDESELYYELSDGQTIKLAFWEWTATALTIPLKYRPKDKDSNTDDAFTTAFNAGVFFGLTKGKTKFHYRKKIGNRTITKKGSFGVFLGTAAETLNKSNTDTLVSGLTGSESRTIGLLSTGLGYVWSRNKLAFGVFVGWDFGAGQISNTWYYDEKKWFGVALGYDIFKL